jgi:hypothetical protein
MKYLPLFLLSFSLNIFAQTKTVADSICGYFYSIDPFTGEGAQNLLYKVADGTYEGKVVWTENPKKKKFIGLIFVRNLKFNELENIWEDGTLKYPGKPGTF